jgi:hypothetical protein
MFDSTAGRHDRDLNHTSDEASASVPSTQGMTQTTRPAEAGPMLARLWLLLTAREAETSEAETKQCESGWLWNRGHNCFPNQIYA